MYVMSSNKNIFLDKKSICQYIISCNIQLTQNFYS